ncbi:MAG: YhcB family protein [Porticoccaceae bacterium]
MSTLTIIITAATFFLIGAGLGHLFARQNQSGDQSVLDLEKKLAQSERQLKRYQQEVTEHFLKVSHLTTSMSQSYRQIHEHLATSAIRLASPEIGRQLLKSGGSDLNLTDEDGKPLINAEDVQPPRDYAPKVPGGILSEDYGFAENEEGKAQPDTVSSEITDSDDEDDDPTSKVI